MSIVRCQCVLWAQGWGMFYNTLKIHFPKPCTQCIHLHWIYTANMLLQHFWYVFIRVFVHFDSILNILEPMICRGPMSQGSFCRRPIFPGTNLQKIFRGTICRNKDCRLNLSQKWFRSPIFGKKRFRGPICCKKDSGAQFVAKKIPRANLPVPNSPRTA